MNGSFAEELYSESLKLSKIELDSTSSTKNQALDFQDSDRDASLLDDESLWNGSDVELDKSSDLDREWQQRRDQFHTMGYRDGVIAGKEAAAQEGFNIGFKQSVPVGYNWGVVRGVTSAVALLPEGLKEKLIETEEKRNQFQKLYKSVQSLSTKDALRLFNDAIVAERNREQVGNAEISSTDEIENQLESYYRELQSLVLGSPLINLQLKEQGTIP
ncbi:protein yae1 [Cannabis sativa]|uniref:Essential protein Yae1 N-terminal domain-containing protein n=1 Tax=Cannabis sativa TaxID=3483 RepID=A0A7J6G7Z9_CANSA|nr:protein yae1 [Cannabis sativa]KAF4378967.1 hypothetical protein F8388_022054 [Cannabis sativa]